MKRRGSPVVERVLEVTLEELARVGFDRLSVPEVAERAELNKTSVYRRWATKGALVRAALERGLGHGAPLPDTGSLRSDMVQFTLGAASWASSPVGLGVTRMLLLESQDPEVSGLVASLARTRSRGPLALFARAKARGELPKHADVRMALTIIAGTLSQRLLVERAAVTPAFVRALVSVVLDGLRAR